MHEHRRVPVSDPQAIDQALSDLRQAARAEATSGGPPVRATVLNLVAYAKDLDLAGEMGEWVAGLAEQHPSRAIILSGRTERDAPGLQIWASAHCHPALAGRLVCFEEILLAAHGPAVERLPAIVLSLLLRDLPVVLWWPGDLPIGTPLFDHLLVDSDRLVADSTSAADPGGLLRRLAALGHAEHCECMISDLNWGRLTPWRELVAQFFDPPECRPFLERLERVRIEYAGEPAHPDTAQPYLLAAWLATRLGWVPAPEPWQRTPEGEQLNLLRERQPVRIDLAGVAEPACARQGLRSLSLSTVDGGAERVCAIRRLCEYAQAKVTTRLFDNEVRQRVVPWPVAGVPGLLGAELARPGYDPVYQEALRMAAFFSSLQSTESM